MAYGGYSLGGLAAIYSLYFDETFSTIFSVCGSFWYPGFADYVVNNNVKNRNAAVYLLNGEQEGVNHGNLLEQAPVKAHMVHEHLMSVMNAVSIFDEYGHHENKSERINRLLSVLTGMEGSYENGTCIKIEATVCRLQQIDRSSEWRRIHILQS